MENETTNGTKVDSALPYPVFTNGVRGFSCPALKLYGFASFSRIEREGAKLLAMPQAKLARKGIFLPAKAVPAKRWPTEAELMAESDALEAAR